MDDDSLHALLSRGRLSGLQRDRILERVLDEHAAPRRASRRWLVAAGAALPAAAIVALALGLFQRSPAGDGVGPLVAKGAPAGAVLEARCANRAPGECRLGDRLIFSVDGAEKGGFFAAFAECASRERIWYFPTADGAMPAVPAERGLFLVNQVARVGDEHGTGPCSLHLFFLDQPESRAVLSSGMARATATAVIPLAVAP